MNADDTEYAKSTEAKLYAVIGRAIADPEFRERLMSDRGQAGALKEHGVEWTETIHNALTGANDSIDGLNRAFGINSIAS